MAVKLNDIPLHEVLFSIFYFDLDLPFISSTLFLFACGSFTLYEEFINFCDEGLIEMLLIELSGDGVSDYKHFDEKYHMLGLQLLYKIFDKLLFFLILFVPIFILLSVINVDINVIVDVVLDFNVDMDILTLFSFQVPAGQL